MTDDPQRTHFFMAERAYERQDFTTAFEEYSLAAETGNIDAVISLAVLYALGAGVDGDGLKSKELLESVITNEQSTVSQVALALNNLSTLYSTGARNISPNTEKAEEYKAMAKIRGFPD